MIAETQRNLQYAVKSNIFDDLFSKVERAKQQWEATVDALPELICTIDGDKRIIRANRTLERWHLGDVTRVAGRDFHDLLHPNCQEPACYLNRLLASLASDPPVEMGRQLEVYDPVLARHVLINACPIPGSGLLLEVAGPTGHAEQDAAAKPAWAMILHDVSQQKRLLHSLQRHADRLKTVNGISRSILAAESPQEIADSALEQLQSFLPLDQAVIFLLNRGRTHLELLSVAQPREALQPGTKFPVAELDRICHRPLDRPYYVSDLSTLRSRSEMEAHYDSQGIVAYASHPLTINGRWLGTLAVGTRQATGFARADLNALPEVAGLLTVALHQSQLHAQVQESNDALQENLRSQKESMQNLSHELRSPLGVMHGFVDLIRDGTLGPLTPRQERALSIVEERGDYLLALVERLLLLQTVGERVTDLEYTNMSAFLRDLVATWELPARNRDVSLSLDLAAGLPQIAVDQSLLTQVFSNLLDNALKFTPSGGTIVVSASATKDEMVVAVADDGAGIPPAKLDTIFRRYEKGKNSGGAGIGLALCREVMNAHGGTVSVASEGEGQGSTFTVRLPRRRRGVESEEMQAG